MCFSYCFFFLLKSTVFSFVSCESAAKPFINVWSFVASAPKFTGVFLWLCSKSMEIRAGVFDPADGRTNGSENPAEEANRAELVNNKKQNDVYGNRKQMQKSEKTLNERTAN